MVMRSVCVFISRRREIIWELPLPGRSCNRRTTDKLDRGLPSSDTVGRRTGSGSQKPPEGTTRADGPVGGGATTTPPAPKSTPGTHYTRVRSTLPIYKSRERVHFGNDILTADVVASVAFHSFAAKAPLKLSIGNEVNQRASGS